MISQRLDFYDVSVAFQMKPEERRGGAELNAKVAMRSNLTSE